MERKLGNKTKVTIEQGCIRPYQSSYMLLQLDEFSKRAGKFKNDISLVIMTFATICCKMYTNSSRVSPFAVEDLGLLFDLQALFG